MRVVGFSPCWSSGKPVQRQRGVRGVLFYSFRASGSIFLESLWNGAVHERKVLLQRLMGLITEKSVWECVLVQH